MNTLCVALKHMIWRFRIYNNFREIFQFCNFMGNNICCENIKAFKYLNRILISNKFPFQRCIICPCYFNRSEMNGRHSVSVLYFEKLCGKRLRQNPGRINKEKKQSINGQPRFRALSWKEVSQQNNIPLVLIDMQFYWPLDWLFTFVSNTVDSALLNVKKKWNGELCLATWVKLQH